MTKRERERVESYELMHLSFDRCHQRLTLSFIAIWPFFGHVSILDMHFWNICHLIHGTPSNYANTSCFSTRSSVMTAFYNFTPKLIFGIRCLLLTTTMTACSQIAQITFSICSYLKVVFFPCSILKMAKYLFIHAQNDQIIHVCVSWQVYFVNFNIFEFFF